MTESSDDTRPISDRPLAVLGLSVIYTEDLIG
jgi:hypothetical protein